MMKISLHGLLIVVCLIADSAEAGKAEVSVQGSAIGLEYIGPVDVPITPVLISETHAGADALRSDVLRRSPGRRHMYLEIVRGPAMRAMLKVIGRYRQIKIRSDESSGILVRVLHDGIRTEFPLPITEGSLMLDEFKRQARGNSSLVSTLTEFRAEIHGESSTGDGASGKGK
jgi:hypothetical protein